MHDIGSDSDATMADSAMEDNEEEEDGAIEEEEEDKMIKYDSALSLQKRQKLLSEKFERSTIPAENVCELQEQFLELEENLRQLSQITRQERKQLSDELESVSVSGNDSKSFQQRLLLLSSKQKAMLKCFEEQKRLGAQLKLISGQSRYCTRSKGLLGQVKEEVSGHVTTSLSQPTSIHTQLPSSSQLTESVTQLLSQPATLSVTKTKDRQQSVGVSKQQQSVGVAKQVQSVGAAKQQQSVGVAKQLQSVGVAKQQQSVGVAKQQQSVGVAKQLQSVGVAKQLQSVGVAKQQSVAVAKQQQSVAVAKQCIAKQQQQSISILQEQVVQKQPQFEHVAILQKSILPSVGVDYQQRPLGVHKQQQTGAVATGQSAGIAAQPGDATQPLSAFVTTQEQRMCVARKQQPAGVAQKQPVGVPSAFQFSSQPGGEAKQPAVGGAARLLQSELAQPVPLDALISHNLIIPQDQLTCTLLGCQFTGSVTDDGSVISQDGRRFSQLSQWINSCWTTLGHNKRVDRKTAYTKVIYKDKPLLHYCLVYSQQKVSNYLSRPHNFAAACTPAEKPNQAQPGGILDIRNDKQRMCLISDHELIPSDDWLPRGFWDTDMILVNSEMEQDLI